MNNPVTTWNNQKDLFKGGSGVANRLELDEDDILHNLQQVQLRNGIAPTPVLKTHSFANIPVKAADGTDTYLGNNAD